MWYRFLVGWRFYVVCMGGGSPVPPLELVQWWWCSVAVVVEELTRWRYPWYISITLSFCFLVVWVGLQGLSEGGRFLVTMPNLLPRLLMRTLVIMLWRERTTLYPRPSPLTFWGFRMSDSYIVSSWGGCTVPFVYVGNRYHGLGIIVNRGSCPCWGNWGAVEVKRSI